VTSPFVNPNKNLNSSRNLYQLQSRNRANPTIWDTLYLDRAIPVDPLSKIYMIRDLQSWTRNYLLIPIKIVANVALGTIMTLKRLLPFQFHAYDLMHNSAAFFLKHFVRPEACYLIVRHLNIGSNVINFLIDNGPDRSIPRANLYPQNVDDLADNAFWEHDLILYNFVMDYHEAQAANPHWLEDLRERGINYASIQPLGLDIKNFQQGFWKILDLESAIELFKVFYSLCLTSDEFARAVISLQFDENFALYVSKVTGDYDWNHIVSNRHPMAPNSPFAAARDLFIHGMINEYLYHYLELQKQARLDKY